ncbi:MAG TPA: L-seryl-tRNA(Sec) selenium transferase [Candidatus Krumholzibacteria bacterium]|nr:L-seryl-tRNA(Sec) selenium transferase [Candidatus Krumholzibacteria bacterium]
MSETRGTDFLRAIPSVDAILDHPAVQGWRAAHPRFPWTRLVRELIDELRAGGAGVPDQPDRAAMLAWIVARAEARVAELRTGGLKPVLNGTGVVLHTNLGRAPVGDRVAEAAVRAMRGYVSLEVDLASGERARRGETLERLLCCLTGAEAAMVVNNNAAAVYLLASSFSPPGRVIVSRGELVEIGGSFRLPDILSDAAAEVAEVGTTNRTYAADYERAARSGDLLLKVHKSNYQIAGFAHEATLAELVTVARARGAHVVFDMGSGAFFDFAGAGVGDDPAVAAVLAAGADGAAMSGDKLLGGLQAGIVVGKRTLIDRLKQNPLRRAVRVDKVTIAALQEIVRCYLFAEDPRRENPSLAMITGGVAARERADRVVRAVRAAAGDAVAIGVVDDDAAVGGGSLSGEAVPSAAVAVGCGGERDALRLARALRLRELPLFTRIRGSEVRINMTTILPSEDGDVIRALVDALAAGGRA